MKTLQEHRKRNHAWTASAAFTLVEIMIVVAIIGLLAIIAVPQVSAARKSSIKCSCLNNLRQLTSACEQYAFGHPGVTPSPGDFAPIYIKAVCICPGGGTYSISSEPAASCSLAASDGHALFLH